MIHPLVDEDAWCYWVVSAGALLSFVGLIAACICSCRRNENKNEFLGLAGMVTLKHSENEGFNGLPALDVPQILTQDAVDCGKRATSANRSLPDIPKDRCGPERVNELETESQDIYETTEPPGDQSELYATVQDKAEWNATGDDSREERGENGARPSAINQSNDAHYQYARYPPNKPNNEEHPYAQLKNVEKVEINQSRDKRNNALQATDAEKPSTSSNPTGASSTSTSNPLVVTVGNPVAPPRSRRSSSHGSLLLAAEPTSGATSTSIDIGAGIQAANAITGGVQANQDLPYMTPPLLAAPFPPYVAAGQALRNGSPLQHFSGDSQDSKGYTSISVREPLANIIAQTKAVSQQHQTTRPLVDSHYTTVSDDSDEMYAAIDEQDKLYTSGSDTYAQIQPTTATTTAMMPDAGRPGSRSQLEHPTHSQVVASRPDDASHYGAPQPPSVDSLRHVAHAHSRQASSSSATSSIINPGSPKPEKRQANSPLPPPPATQPIASQTTSVPTAEQSSTAYDATTEVYAHVDKKSRAPEVAKCAKSLEDMYAKVMKKRKDEEVGRDRSERGAAVGQGQGFGQGQGQGFGQGQGQGFGQGQGQSFGQGQGQGFGQGQGHNQGFGQSQGHNQGFAPSQGHNQGFGQNQGHNQSFAPSQGHNQCFGQGQVHAQGHNQTHGQLYTQGHGQTHGPGHIQVQSLNHHVLAEGVKAVSNSHEGVQPGVLRGSCSNHEQETRVHAALGSFNDADDLEHRPEMIEELDHGYEPVSSKSRHEDPDYETLRPQHAARKVARNSADFARIEKDFRGDISGQLIYSSVPLKHRQVSNASSDDPGYERVRLTSRVPHLDDPEDTDSEPNYESMPHDVCEPSYASVLCRPGDSDTDPNYESVGHVNHRVNDDADDDDDDADVGAVGDPNYESVRYVASRAKSAYEPPYEQLAERNARVPSRDDYEKVSAGLGNAPGYEKIGREPEETRSGGETDDEQYVQV